MFAWRQNSSQGHQLHREGNVGERQREESGSALRCGCEKLLSELLQHPGSGSQAFGNGASLCVQFVVQVCCYLHTRQITL